MEGKGVWGALTIDMPIDDDDEIWELVASELKEGIVYDGLWLKARTKTAAFVIIDQFSCPDRILPISFSSSMRFRSLQSENSRSDWPEILAAPLIWLTI